MDALIGHTGFVGTTLRHQHDFAGCFNSTNIADAAGRRFDTVVCAAAPGSMFEANRFPERDLGRIEALVDHLAQIEAERFVLISTVACLAGFRAEDEGTEAFETELAYGRNRRMLEAAVADRFERALIVRLPALYGRGLKKNFLFDMLNPMPAMMPPAGVAALGDALPQDLADLVARLYEADPELGLAVIDRAALDASGRRDELEAATSAAGLTALRFTHPDSEFQFYPMDRLWRDIGLGLTHGLEVLHLAPPPIRAGTIHQRLTGRPMPHAEARIHREDMRTRHAGLWGAEGPYFAGEDAVLAGLAAFMQSERVTAGAAPA